MRTRSPARARFLGLWTAGWLALLLVLGMVRFGDPALQWPVLLVPALWALVALRPRRPAERRPPARARRRPPADEDLDDWPEEPWTEDTWTEQPWTEEQRAWPPPGERTDTVERPALRRRSDRRHDRW